MTSTTSYSDTNNRQGILRWIIQMMVSLMIAWLVLFFSSGRLNWAAGWAFFCLNAITQILRSLLLVRRQPTMLADCTKTRAGTKGWDKFFAPTIAIFGSLAMLVIAGLDTRFDWSKPVSSTIWQPGIRFVGYGVHCVYTV